MSSLWLVLFTSRLLHNGTCCVGFDWSYVSAKVAWAIGSPESKKKSACPARPQELDDDADDIPIVHSDRSTVSEEEDEDNKPLVQPSSGRKQLKRESSATRRVPTPLGQKLRVGDQKTSRVWANIQMVKLSRKLSTRCRTLAAWRTSTWSTTTRLLHSSRRERLTWIFQVRFMTFTSMW